MSKVAAPLSVIIQVGVVSASVGALTLTFALSIDPVTVVSHTTFVSALALAVDLTLNEVTHEAGSVLHQENTVTMLLAVDPTTLVLEEGVSVGVGTCACSKLGDGVDLSHVAAFLVLEFGIVNGGLAGLNWGWGSIFLNFLRRFI